MSLTKLQKRFARTLNIKRCIHEEGSFRLISTEEFFMELSFVGAQKIFIKLSQSDSAAQAVLLLQELKLPVRLLSTVRAEKTKSVQERARENVRHASDTRTNTNQYIHKYFFASLRSSSCFDLNDPRKSVINRDMNSKSQACRHVHTAEIIREVLKMNGIWFLKLILFQLLQLELVFLYGTLNCMSLFRFTIYELQTGLSKRFFATHSSKYRDFSNNERFSFWQKYVNHFLAGNCLRVTVREKHYMLKANIGTHFEGNFLMSSIFKLPQLDAYWIDYKIYREQSVRCVCAKKLHIMLDIA